MRRLLLFLPVLCLFSQLWALTLTPAEGVEADESLLELVAETLEEEGGDILPPGIGQLTVSGYEEDEYAVFITVGPWTLAFDKDREEESVREEIRSFLVYAPWLEAVDGPSLDYIHGSSYSSLDLGDADRGEVYELVAPYSGEKTARLIVAEQGDGYTRLDPVHVGSAHAGLALEKASPWVLTLSLFKPLSLWDWDLSAGASLRVRNTSWLYPFNPSLGFEAGLDGSMEPWYAGLVGIEYTLRLGGLVDSRLSLIEDAALYAGVDIVLGYGDGSFIWGSSWRVGYSHSPSRHFFWSLGYEGVLLRAQRPSRAFLSQNRLTCSMGVMF